MAVRGYGILTLDHKTECDVLQELQIFGATAWSGDEMQRSAALSLFGFEEAPVVPGAPIALLGAGSALGRRRAGPRSHGSATLRRYRPRRSLHDDGREW